MEKAISEIVGRAELNEGGSTDVYRALRSLLCATCGAAIAEGALFTRRRVKGIGVRIMPQCLKCAPFILQAGRKEKSALLRSLLEETPQEASSRAGDSARSSSEASSQSSREEKSLDEKVRGRLGPALKHGRLKRR